MGTTVHSFGVGPIDCHAWSGDRKQLALTRNSKEVKLYSSNGKGFEEDGKLDQHDLRVSFSHDGDRLAWIAHDASINIADAKNGLAVTSLRTDALPMLSLTWAGPNTLLAAGHNCVPFAFNVDGKGNISPGTKLEEGKGNAASGANSAMDMFKKKDLLGTSDMTTKLNTTHQNQVSELRHYSGDKASVGTISTVAGDGKLVLWDPAALKLKGLKI